MTLDTQKIVDEVQGNKTENIYHSKALTASISETNFSIPFVSSSTATPSLNLTITKCLNSPIASIPQSLFLAATYIYSQFGSRSWSVLCQNPMTPFIAILINLPKKKSDGRQHPQLNLRKGTATFTFRPTNAHLLSMA